MQEGGKGGRGGGGDMGKETYSIALAEAVMSDSLRRTFR